MIQVVQVLRMIEIKTRPIPVLPGEHHTIVMDIGLWIETDVGSMLERH